MSPRPSRSTLFPYTTLFRSVGDQIAQLLGVALEELAGLPQHGATLTQTHPRPRPAVECFARRRDGRCRVRRRGERHPSEQDRKSTCLNSSHSSISYAVFCLK